jgi:Cdc6-like AAA superfamily ATPase
MADDKPPQRPVYIISDSPEEDSGLFGYEAYAKTIADLIAFKENRTPLVIGIYGPWGSGKTTLMRTVQTRLKALAKQKDLPPDTYRTCKTVWFNAWRYDQPAEILAALIEAIFKAMRDDGWLETAKVGIADLMQKLKPFKVAGAAGKALTGINVCDFFAESEHKAKLSFYDRFQVFLTGCCGPGST